MPGIVGLVTKRPREEALRHLARMLRTLCHEPSYLMGTWVDESMGMYIGWVTRKGSFSDGMPLRNERGDVVLIFSGEEFPELGTERRLKQRGHELDAHGPSYLVHLYEEDPSFPAGLNGRFHGLLVDRNRRTAVLFNDRYGMHRIYYHRSKDGFYFAVEAKAILAVRPETRGMDPRGVGEFVACGCTLEGRSLFEDVHVLPGGAKWVFRDGSLVEKQAYFEPGEWENQEPLEPQPYYQELRDVFSRNLPRYFNGAEPIGMSLTGGLDTRMIMAWQKCSPGSLPCYTFGGVRRDCRDVIVGRQVARMCDQPHEVISVGKEFLAEFPGYAERSVFLTDGSVDVGRAPDLYLNEKAREIAPVRMSGFYGGEVLRGVRTFKAEQTRPGLLAPEFDCYLSQARETYARIIQGHPISFAVFKQAPWSMYGIQALEQAEISLRSPFLDNDLVRTAFRAPESARTSNETSLRLIAEGNGALLRIPTDRGLGGKRWRLSGTASHAVLDFLFKAEYVYDMGMPQWLAGIDHAFSSFHLERLFLGRHKIFHFRVWYRDALASYVRETLLDSRSLSRPYIERRGLESIVRGHLNGNRNYTTELHKMLTLELVHRLFLDNLESGSIGELPDVPIAASVNH